MWGRLYWWKDNNFILWNKIIICLYIFCCSQGTVDMIHNANRSPVSSWTVNSFDVYELTYFFFIYFIFFILLYILFWCLWYNPVVRALPANCHGKAFVARSAVGDLLVFLPLATAQFVRLQLVGRTQKRCKWSNNINEFSVRSTKGFQKVLRQILKKYFIYKIYKIIFLHSFHPIHNTSVSDV